jgi:hypothetical protein
VLFFRANSELFVDNMIRMFDPEQKGFVKFSELLLTFSMAMRGSGKSAIKCNNIFV